MLFKFLTKPLYVDVFTNHQRAFKDYKIDKASKFLPNWWKKTEKNFKIDNSLAPGLTLKTCAGLINNYKTGIIVPLWTDLLIQQKFISEDSYQINWEAADKQTSISSHSAKQWNTYLNPKDYFHLKIDTPWAIKTKKLFQWYMTSPYWNLNPFKLSVSSGILDFYNIHMVNINLFFPSQKDPIFISQNTPISHLIPLTNKKIKLVYHLVDDQEFKKYENIRSRFVNDFLSKATKCPFNK